MGGHSTGGYSTASPSAPPLSAAAQPPWTFLTPELEETLFRGMQDLGFGEGGVGGGSGSAGAWGGGHGREGQQQHSHRGARPLPLASLRRTAEGLLDHLSQALSFCGGGGAARAAAGRGGKEAGQEVSGGRPLSLGGRATSGGKGKGVKVSAAQQAHAGRLERLARRIRVLFAVADSYLPHDAAGTNFGANDGENAGWWAQVRGRGGEAKKRGVCGSGCGCGACKRLLVCCSPCRSGRVPCP